MEVENCVIEVKGSTLGWYGFQGSDGGSGMADGFRN